MKVTTPRDSVSIAQEIVQLAGWVSSVVLALLVTLPALAQSSEIFPVSEVRRGQTGYGLSVFSGQGVERFDVEILGVVHNMRPNRSFVIAKLSGQGLEQAGVVAGMSGSPVYLNDRLLGAVAFSWDFSLGAIGGITPIADMRELRAGSTASADGRLSIGRAPRPVSWAADEVPSPMQLLEGDLDQWLAGLFPKSFSGARSALQVTGVGLSEHTRSRLTAAFGERGVLGLGGSTPPSADEGLAELEAGSMIGAVLVDGDLRLAVTGTISERRGDELLAFGHSYLGLGEVSLPLAPAEVVSVIPSRLSSFKLTNVGEVIGAFDQDRDVGMRAVIGAEARLLPASIRLNTEAGAFDFDVEIADLPQMRPTLLAISMLQAIESWSSTGNEQNLSLDARFEIAEHPTLVTAQDFDGSGAPMDAAIYLLNLAYFLENNTWRDVAVEGVEIELTQRNRPLLATLQEAYADRRQVRPGDEVEITLVLQGHGGESYRQQVTATVPEDADPGVFYFFVGDGQSIDSARQRMEPFAAGTFDEALAQLNGYRARSDLAVLGVARRRGVIHEGEALPDLPASVRSLFRSSSEGQTKTLALTVVSDQTLDLQRPFSGAGRIDLRVLPSRSPAGAAD